MKIVVIGTGAMGSIYAGLLADVGNDVWAVDIWKEHLDAIRTTGLRVEGASGDRVVKGIKATPDAAEVGDADLVIIATKAAGVGAAAESIVPILRDDTLVLTIQNGLGAGERISHFMPMENVLLGVAGGFGASMKGPGHAYHNGMQLIRVGEMQGGLTDRVEQVAQIWQDAGFNVKAFEDINQLIWEKFICNVAFSGPCTIFERAIRGVMDDPHAWQIALGCGLEADAVARAKGINLSFEDGEAYIIQFGNNLLDAKPSMLQDHLAQRRSEIDAINGMVPIVAQEVGLQAPYNEVVTAMVRSRELAFG